MQLKDLKEVNPVEVAKYVAARGLVDEVAFQWWVPYTLRKKATIIALVKGRAVKRKTHKYGVQVPTSVEEALELDKENNNSMWQDALKLEMGEIGKAVRFTLVYFPRWVLIYSTLNLLLLAVVIRTSIHIQATVLVEFEIIVHGNRCKLLFAARDVV